MGPMIKFADNLILKVEDESAATAVLNLYLRNKIVFERFEPTRPEDFYTLEYHATSLRRELKAYRLGTFLRYYIYMFPNENRIIGSINCNFLSDGYNRFVEIGYKIDTAFQNKGIAYCACQTVLSVLRKDYGITRVDARIHPDNIPSQKLANKLGFKPVKLEPKSASVNGHYVDLMRYSLDISDIQ